AVALGRVKGAKYVPVLADVAHRRRPRAAISRRRRQLRVELDVGQIVRTVEHPDVIVPVDGESRDTADFPLVGKGLGPFGIVLVSRRGLRAASGIEGEDPEA